YSSGSLGGVICWSVVVQPHRPSSTAANRPSLLVRRIASSLPRKVNPDVALSSWSRAGELYRRTKNRQERLKRDISIIGYGSPLPPARPRLQPVPVSVRYLFSNPSLTDSTAAPGPPLDHGSAR